MFGVFVTYSDNLINLYRALLKDLFDRALKPFYNDDIQLPQEKIEKILQAKEMKKLGMPYHSFQTDYYIWRQLRIKKALQLPIPPCNRILPYNHPVWNNLIKGYIGYSHKADVELSNQVCFKWKVSSGCFC
jgi:hypothetical protein